MPNTLEDITNLRKKFSRKTAQCFNEILSILSRAHGRVREEERSGFIPVKGGIVKQDNFKREKLSLTINELKADESIHELAIKIGQMSIIVQKSSDTPRQSTLKDTSAGKVEEASENLMIPDLFTNGSLSKPKTSKKPVKARPNFKYTSFLDYLREIYPGTTIQAAKKQDIKIENELTKNQKTDVVEKVETSEFIGIGDKTGEIVQSFEDTTDIMEKMENSLLPSSLKEKFKVDLLKIKKKDFTAKVVVQKKAVKVNQLQATSRDIFEQGNVFEVLKSKDVDRMSEDEGKLGLISDAAETQNDEKPKNFWDVYNEMAHKQSQAKREGGPQVGEFGGAKLSKKKNPNHKKAQFSQPSIRNNVKF